MRDETTRRRKRVTCKVPAMRKTGYHPESGTGTCYPRDLPARTCPPHSTVENNLYGHLYLHGAVEREMSLARVQYTLASLMASWNPVLSEFAFPPLCFQVAFHVQCC